MSNIFALPMDFQLDEMGEMNLTIYPTILKDDRELILVDCGYPNFMLKIEGEMNKIGLSLNQLTKIIITHHDHDHMGALREIKEQYPYAEILCSKESDSIDDLIKDSEANIEEHIGMKIEISADSKVETGTYSGIVIFNEGKRTTQIAAAMTSADISVIMDILNKDLSDCKRGLRNRFCDKNEVSKVKAMIQKAQSKQQKIAAQERSDKEKGKETPDKLKVNLLM